MKISTIVILVTIATPVLSVAGVSASYAAPATRPSSRTTQTSPALVRATGTYVVAGAHGTFTRTVDERNGYSRLDVVNGPVKAQSGYDGKPWRRHDGILVTINMPGNIADARAQAFVLREGWHDPKAQRYIHPLGVKRIVGVKVRGESVSLPHANRVDLWFSVANRQLVQSTLHADEGLHVTRYSHWHKVHGRPVAWKRVTRNSIGATKTFIVKTAKVLSPEHGSLLRPPPSAPHATWAGPKAVPFTMAFGHYGQPIVAARLDGHPVKLIFDTGGANYFTPAVAKKYGLKVSGGVHIGGPGTGGLPGGYALVRRLSIGPATLENTTAMIAWLPRGAIHPRPGITTIGLTGFQFVSEFRVEFDNARHETIFTPFDKKVTVSPDSTTVPLLTDGHDIYVEGKIDGHPGLLRLDTGDAHDLEVASRFARINGLDKGAPLVSKGQLGGNANYLKTLFQSVSLGGVTFHNVSGRVSNQHTGRGSSRTIAANVGDGLLSKFNIAIDFKAKTVTFTPIRAGTSAVGRRN